jgi:hypothetical protein
METSNGGWHDRNATITARSGFFPAALRVARPTTYDRNHRLKGETDIPVGTGVEARPSTLFIICVYFSKRSNTRLRSFWGKSHLLSK